MLPSNRSVKQAWLWALGVNIVVFGVLWFVLVRIPLPTQAKSPESSGGTVSVNEQDPGGSFGEMTKLFGDEATVEGETPPEPGPAATEPVAEEPQSETASMTSPPETAPESESAWIDEFYLGPDPAISFAPRLNPDGTPRSLPSDLDWYKGPAYDDDSTRLSEENINIPVPDLNFSKNDLPESYRNYNHNLTLRVRLDSRGHVQGEPEIIESSGYPAVDRITIDKIKNDVNFPPATRKDNGEPVPVVLYLPVMWN
jgi:hypothetical protein